MDSPGVAPGRGRLAFDPSPVELDPLDQLEPRNGRIARSNLDDGLGLGWLRWAVEGRPATPATCESESGEG